MKRILFVLLIFSACYASTVVAQQSLELAFDSRLVNPSYSKTQIENVSLAGLSEKEKTLYQYLRAYHLAVDGQLRSSFDVLQTLQEFPGDNAINLAMYNTHLSVAVGLRKWSQSFVIIEKIQAILNEQQATLELDDVHATLFGLANFYYVTRQYEETIYHSRALLNEPLSSLNRCLANSILISAYVDSKAVSLARDNMERAQNACALFQQIYAAKTIELNKLKLRWHASNGEKDVYEAMLNFDSELNTANDLILKMKLRSFIAEASVRLGRLDEALQFALWVINREEQTGILLPVLSAYSTASVASYSKGQVDKAYYYQTAYIDRMNENYAEQSVLLTAIQNKQIELHSIENEFADLNSENKLLQTQAEYAKQRSQTILIALSLCVLLLIGLVYWIWRARKIQLQLQQAAQTDFLTKSSNREHFTNQTVAALEQLKVKRTPTSLLLFDLDHFKRINDNFGHQIGDWALRATVRAVSNELGEDCVIGRMGGEEFAVLLTNVNIERALKIAERCRKTIQAIDTNATKQVFTITASFGVSEAAQVGYSFDNLMSAADLALYQSKRKGRNRVYEYSHSMSFGDN